MYAQANQTATEAISAIRTVAAFGMEHEVSSLYGQKLERPTRQARDRSVSTGGPRGLHILKKWVLLMGSFLNDVRAGIPKVSNFERTGVGKDMSQAKSARRAPSLPGVFCTTGGTVPVDVG